MADIGRNEPCPCGKKKPDGNPVKYKYCHLGKKIPLRHPNGYFHWMSGMMFDKSGNNLSLYERNTTMLEGIITIFGLDGKRTWTEVKHTISRDRVKEFYKLMAWLWPPDTDVAKLLPKPDDKLRGFYVGWMRPESVIGSVVRHSLYTDETLVTIPFLNPWAIVPEYNPLVHPEEYVADTLRWVVFVLQLAPWILSGHVILVPHPEDFDYSLRQKTWKLAEARMSTLTEKDKEEMVNDPVFEKLGEADFQRSFFSIPTHAMRRKIKDFYPKMSDNQVDKLLAYIQRTKEKDPYYPTNPNENGALGLQIGQTGSNLEMALYLAQATGSYLYTDFQWRWKEILSTTQESGAGQSRDWSGIAKSFQGLDFKFLDKTTPEFANRIREEGRLSSMREFLRTTYNTVKSEPGEKTVEEISRSFKDQMQSEFAKAETDWKRIDTDLLAWTTSEGGVGQILTAGMDWKLPAIGFSIAAVGELVRSHFKRKEFRSNVPLSVFVDLKRKGK